MSEAKQNYVAGAWIDGASASPNVNPSDTADVIADYVRGDAAQATAAIAAAKAAAPRWAESGIQQRHDVLAAVAAEITARKDEIGYLLAREEGKTLA